MSKLLDISNEITICKQVPTKQNLIRALELVKQGDKCLISAKSNDNSPQDIVVFLKLIKTVLMKYTYQRVFDTHQSLADIEKLFVKIVWSQASILKMGDKKMCGDLVSVATQCAHFDKVLQTKLRLLSKELRGE